MDEVNCMIESIFLWHLHEPKLKSELTRYVHVHVTRANGKILCSQLLMSETACSIFLSVIAR